MGGLRLDYKLRVANSGYCLSGQPRQFGLGSWVKRKQGVGDWGEAAEFLTAGGPEAYLLGCRAG